MHGSDDGTLAGKRLSLILGIIVFICVFSGECLYCCSGLQGASPGGESESWTSGHCGPRVGCWKPDVTERMLCLMASQSLGLGTSCCGVGMEDWAFGGSGPIRWVGPVVPMMVARVPKPLVHVGAPCGPLVQERTERGRSRRQVTNSVGWCPSPGQPHQRPHSGG